MCWYVSRFVCMYRCVCVCACMRVCLLLTHTRTSCNIIIDVPPDICRIGYQTIPNQYQSLGQVVAVQTMAQCIATCLADTQCLAADFNHNAPPNFNCFKHTQIVSTDISNDNCCTRYVKVTCKYRTDGMVSIPRWYEALYLCLTVDWTCFMQVNHPSEREMDLSVYIRGA